MLHTGGKDYQKIKGEVNPKEFTREEVIIPSVQSYFFSGQTGFYRYPQIGN